MTRTDTLPAKGATAFLALSCVGFIASGAPAQTTQPVQATELEGVSVTDTAINDEVKVERVESPKAVRSLLDTPQTITVIGNVTIRQQNLLSLRDALATVPGITFGAGEGGGGYGDSINLRGQSANNDLQIDGVRDTAQYSRTDTFNIEQIEVVNGPNSVNSGSGSIGGSINLITKRPKAQDLTVIQGGIGTDDYYRGTVDSNIRTGNLAFRLNAMVHRNDIPGRDVERMKRWGIAPAVTWGIETPTSMTLMYVHQKDNNTPSYGVPYYNNGIYGGPLPGVDYGAYFGFRNVDKQDQTVDQGTAIFAHKFSDMVSLRNLTRIQRVKQDLIVDPPQGTYCLAATNRTPAGAACTVAATNTATTPAQTVTVTIPTGFYLPTGPRGNARYSINDTYYDQLDLTFNFKGGHTLNIGASYLAEDYDLSTGNVLRNADGSNPYGLTGNTAAVAAAAHLPYINIATPGTIVAGPAQTDASYGNNVYTGPYNYIQSAAQTGDLTNLAVYAFGALKLLSKLELNAGVRFENSRVTYRADTVGTPAAGRLYTAGPDQRQNDNLFSYRAGLVYKPVETASLYIAYGNSKTPTAANSRVSCGLISVQTLGADPCNVKPQEAVNYEVGAKADVFGRKLQLTASLFRNERTNYPVASNDPLIGALQVNDGRSRVDGLTLGASGKITPDWSIFANYTYLKTKVLQSVSNYCLTNPGRTFTPAGGTAITCAASDTQKGQPLTNTPKHSGSLFTTYLLPFGLQLGYGLTYQGSFLLNNLIGTPIFKAKDYLVHRAFASYPITDRVTAQVNIQNFTNEKYYTGIRNNGWAVPGEARQALLSVYYNF